MISFKKGEPAVMLRDYDRAEKGVVVIQETPDGPCGMIRCKNGDKLFWAEPKDLGPVSK